MFAYIPTYKQSIADLSVRRWKNLSEHPDHTSLQPSSRSRYSKLHPIVYAVFTYATKLLVQVDRPGYLLLLPSGQFPLSQDDVNSMREYFNRLDSQMPPHILATHKVSLFFFLFWQWPLHSSNFLPCDVVRRSSR